MAREDFLYTPLPAGWTAQTLTNCLNQVEESKRGKWLEKVGEDIHSAILEVQVYLEAYKTIPTDDRGPISMVCV